jgi:hypothetical protein
MTISRAVRRRSEAVHEGFLRHRRFAYLRLALLLCVLSAAAYLALPARPTPSGGSIAGYGLGGLSAGLVVWLALLGIRKRAAGPGAWSLKGWTSAHVYLGLSLAVIATLHAGFQFGANVHTLAYALMMAVIVSGIFGVCAYVVIPRRMSDNRAQLSAEQLAASVYSGDAAIREAARPLAETEARLVHSALENTKIGGGLIDRFRIERPSCPNRVALAALRRSASRAADIRPGAGDAAADALERVALLLEKREAMLVRARRHARYRGILEIWLLAHVPATFALLAAIIAHVVAVFFMW